MNVTPQQKVKIMGEITILEQVKHQNIMDIFHSWETEDGEYVVFITEIMSSGTLKEFVTICITNALVLFAKRKKFGYGPSNNGYGKY